MKFSNIYNFVLGACAVIYCTLGIAEMAAIPSCSEPEPAYLEEMLKNHTTEKLFSSLQEFPTSNFKFDDTASDEPELLIFGNNICPANINELPNGVNSKLYERSTCPYFYIASHDSTRYPRMITEVRCTCPRCLTESGLSPSNGCEPVYMIIPILKRGTCVNGVYQYHVSNYNKQYGCTCARMRQAVSSSSQSQDDPEPM